MIKPYFKDPVLEQEINENGYVVLPGFLPANEVGKLLEVYGAHHSERAQHCWNSHVDLPIETGAEVSAQIRALMEPRLDNIFEDWVFPYAQFISKNPGVAHGCFAHRDDTIFDEQQIEYRQLWMPLVDLTPQNGVMYMVPKSHKLFTVDKPAFVQWQYLHLIPSLEKHYVPIYAKAGDLFIWIDRTLHGSYENIGTTTRPAFQGGVIHKDTPPCFYRYVPERNEVEVYQVNPEFFMNKEYLDAENFKKYRLIKTEKYSVKNITAEDIEQFYEAQRQVEAAHV